MIPVLTPETRQLICERCNENIAPSRERGIFILRKSVDISGPFSMRIQPTDFIMGDDELAFCSPICVKKWLLKWVDVALAQSMKATQS